MTEEEKEEFEKEQELRRYYSLREREGIKWRLENAWIQVLIHARDLGTYYAGHDLEKEKKLVFDKALERFNSRYRIRGKKIKKEATK